MTSGFLLAARLRSRTTVAVALFAALGAVTLSGDVAFAPRAAAQPAPAAPDTKLGKCAAGELCLWEKPNFSGKRVTYDLAKAGTESCVRLPRGFAANAYGNRTGRPVTTYQSVECATTAEFHTHPGGSWTPKSAYQVRAIKIWER